jgi:hypothetical protein
MATPDPSLHSDYGLSTDQIHKVVEHPYFKTLLEQQVHQETNAQLDRWLKRIAAPVILAVSVASYLGYRDITNVQKLTEDTDKKIEAAQEKSASVLAQIEAAGAKADELLHQSKDALGKVSEATGMIEAGKLYLHDSQGAAEKITTLQYQAVQDTLKNQKATTEQALDLSAKAMDLAKSTDDFKKVVDRINATGADVNQKKEQIDGVSDSVESTAKRIIGIEKQIQDDATLREQMIRARTFGPFILRINQQAQVDVIDPRDPQGTHKYRVYVDSDSVKPDTVSLQVRVKELWETGKSHPEETIPKLAPNSSFPLKEAPGLAIYLDSIKHQTFSHSFALLHVGAADGTLR